MKHLFYFLFLYILVSSCNTKDHKTENAVSTTGSTGQKENPVKDTTPRVTGIGGIFFGSDKPKETMEWYGKNLGITLDAYGSVFEFRNANNPEEINYLRWSPYNKGDAYFDPSDKEFMINYRVQNIESLVRNLRSNGVTMVDKIETNDDGKFVHIMDLDGNKIELWEPVDSALTKLGTKTTR